MSLVELPEVTEEQLAYLEKMQAVEVKSDDPRMQTVVGGKKEILFRHSDVSPELLEKVCRAICHAEGWSPDGALEGLPSWQYRDGEAYAAIKAVREYDAQS